MPAYSLSVTVLALNTLDDSLPALERANVVGTHGVFVMSAQDHNGLDNRARVMVKVENDKWVLIK